MTEQPKRNGVVGFLLTHQSTVIFIITVFITSVGFYFSIKNAVAQVWVNTPRIEKLEKFQAVQEEVHRSLEDKLDRIETKIDRNLDMVMRGIRNR